MTPVRLEHQPLGLESSTTTALLQTIFGPGRIDGSIKMEMR